MGESEGVCVWECGHCLRGWPPERISLSSMQMKPRREDSLESLKRETFSRGRARTNVSREKAGSKPSSPSSSREQTRDTSALFSGQRSKVDGHCCTYQTTTKGPCCWLNGRFSFLGREYMLQRGSNQQRGDCLWPTCPPTPLPLRCCVEVSCCGWHRVVCVWLRRGWGGDDYESTQRHN